MKNEQSHNLNADAVEFAARLLCGNFTLSHAAPN